MSTTIQWNPFANNSVICNSSDWQPSFFVNNDSLLNVKITGEIIINSSANDDDFVGFVFGYTSPTASTNSNDNHYYVFDWRKNGQHAPLEYGGFLAREGFSLSYAHGLISNDPITTYQCFWGHEENESFLPIDNLYGNEKGWEYNTAYHFELIYTYNKIIIRIDEEEIFNIDGCYQPGLFGLYSFNQNGVVYKDVVFEQYYDINLLNEDEIVCEEIELGFNFMDTICADLPESLTSFEWSFGDMTPNSNDLVPLHTYADAGIFDVELYLTDLNYCTDTLKKTIYVEPKAIILNQPEDVECFVGDIITFSVDVENVEFYQWYYQEEGMNYWSKLTNNGYYTGVTTNQIQVFNVRSYHDQMKFRCVVKGYCNNPVTSAYGQIFITDIPVRGQIASTASQICAPDSTILLLTLKEIYLVKSANMRILYDTNSFEVSNYTSYFQDINFNFTLEENYMNIDFSTIEPINLNEAILASVNIKSKGYETANLFFNWDDENTFFLDVNGDTINNFLFNTSVKVNIPISSGFEDTISICKGNQLELDQQLFNSIIWSTGDDSPNLTIQNGGDYWVELVDRNSCYSLDSFYIVSIAQPQSPRSIILEKPFYCSFDELVEFTVDGGSGTHLRYNYSGNTIIDSVLSSPTYLIPNQSTDFFIRVSWSNSCGESQDLVKFVPVYPTVEPSVSILANQTNIELGEYVSFNAVSTGVGNNPNYIWSLDSEEMQSGSDEVFITNELKHNQELKLSLYSDVACPLDENYAEATLRITLEDHNDFYIPSLVVINGSSNHDSFKVIFRRNNVYNFLLQIYDLRGRLVFETQDRFDSWSGQNINAGSYGMYTYRLQYSKEINPVGDQMQHVSGKFLLKK